MPYSFLYVERSDFRKYSHFVLLLRFIVFRWRDTNAVRNIDKSLREERKADSEIRAWRKFWFQ